MYGKMCYYKNALERVLLYECIIIVYPGKQNKALSSTSQPPEEGRSVQLLKRCDKHGDKDENNSPKNVNN